jgi:hypothetical protein
MEKKTISVMSTILSVPKPPVPASAALPLLASPRVLGLEVFLVGIQVGNPILFFILVGNKEIVGYLIKQNHYIILNTVHYYKRYLVKVGVRVYGATVGTAVGQTVGRDGVCVVGLAEDGVLVGMRVVGALVGLTEGKEVGTLEGRPIGTRVGFEGVGLLDGLVVGIDGLEVEEVGVLDGFCVGTSVGALEGF